MPLSVRPRAGRERNGWEDAVAMTVDPRAASGFANAVDAYQRGRPSYPADAVATVAGELGLNAASTALDLAAGTGKLTRLLVPLAGRVIAVEPSHAMLTELRANLPTADARAGTAEAIPAEDASVDAVFVGEAFHWFRTADACREIARVLVPCGGLALLWNRARWTEKGLPWLPAFDALVKPHRQAAGRFPAEADQWRPALEQTGLFTPLSHAEADHVHRIGADDFVALVASWSWIANLPDEQRDAVLTQVRALIGDEPQLALRYRTEVYWTRSTA
jgi:SAM-dependent methyltransferase